MNFTLKAGLLAVLAIVPLINGNPDGEAVVNSYSFSGDNVRQLASPTVMSDGSTAPAGAWVVDLSSAAEGSSGNITATANVHFADGQTRNLTQSASYTAQGEESSNTYGLGITIGGANPDPAQVPAQPGSGS